MASPWRLLSAGWSSVTTNWSRLFKSAEFRKLFRVAASSCYSIDRVKLPTVGRHLTPFRSSRLLQLISLTELSYSNDLVSSFWFSFPSSFVSATVTEHWNPSLSPCDFSQRLLYSWIPTYLSSSVLAVNTSWSNWSFCSIRLRFSPFLTSWRALMSNLLQK